MLCISWLGVQDYFTCLVNITQKMLCGLQAVSGIQLEKNTNPLGITAA